MKTTITIKHKDQLTEEDLEYIVDAITVGFVRGFTDGNISYWRINEYGGDD